MDYEAKLKLIINYISGEKFLLRKHSIARVYVCVIMDVQVSVCLYLDVYVSLFLSFSFSSSFLSLSLTLTLYLCSSLSLSLSLYDSFLSPSERH